MKICLCDKSALEFWRRFDNRVEGVRVFGHTPNAGPVLVDALASSRLRSVSGLQAFGCGEGALAAYEMGECGVGPHGETHILLSREKRRRAADFTRVHSVGFEPPEGALLEIGPHVCTVSPEFLVAMLSKKLDFVELLKIAYELCGCYSLRVDAESGFAQRHPLCTPGSVGRLLDRIDALSASARFPSARLVVRYLRAGSGSPRETALVLLLCLPMRYGGFGLPFPELNYRLDLGDAASALWEGDNAFDLVWPDRRLVVEYDGKQAHEGFAAHERDSRRRAALVAAGYTVVVVTKSQMDNMNAMYAIAQLVAKKVGRRLRFRASNFRTKHMALRSALL